MATDSKVALVTGSSSGIGAATVKLFSEKGYKVAICGSNPERVKKIADECVKLSPNSYEPLSLVLDFSNPDNGGEAARRTIEFFGRLDVLVNNAGIFTRTLGSDGKSYSDYRRVMQINIDSTVSCTLAALEELKKSQGNIVMVSSVASVKPSERGYAYCMSKAAMSSFGKCLAIDLAPFKVRVNVVSPGPVDTSIFARAGFPAHPAFTAAMGSTTLVQRCGDPEDIAKVVAFLVSDDATFVDGQEMFVDGGYMIKPTSSSVSTTIIKAQQQDQGKQ